MRTSVSALSIIIVALALGSASVADSIETSWRYYRPGNTGIQGDYNEAIWIGADGDPYIGGYDPFFEEGGFAKFIQSENRWVNYSNVDYRVIGHPDSTGCVRVTDMVPDATGKLWMATWRGALTFDPAVGASSLTRYGPGNSALIDGRVWDIDCAPDGTIWFVNGGSARYDPATDTWTRWGSGNVFLSVQPKATGGYLVWSSTRPPFQDYTFVFDSGTQQWTTIVPSGAPGEVVGMPGKDCVDEAGNFWALRSTTPGGFDSMDYRRSNGTWVTPPEPYPSATFGISAFKAYGDRRALLVDGSGAAYQFNGSNWVSLGTWTPGAFTEAVDIDAAGNVWVCGVGGAAKRNVQTGQWQRYRMTNTSNFDHFNRDLTIDPVNGYVYTGANAGPGVGGMVRFDGARWTCWDQLTYGLGYDWPFPNDFCTTLAYRPSSRRVAVSPLNWLDGIHEWTGSSFNTLLPIGGADLMHEDSRGRLWATDTAALTVLDEAGWRTVGDTGGALQTDPDRPGTVWVSRGYEFVRTDGGAYNLLRTMADFPELPASLFFNGLAVEPNGPAWLGAFSYTDGTGLIHFDAETGAYQVLRPGPGWPFPSPILRPWVVTPDGRVWMQYGDLEQLTDCGLCWYDGAHVGVFPAPPGGEPQWGGLPHGQIHDIEVRVIPGGYELWMSCASRGLAVLTVHPEATSVAGEPGTPAGTSLRQNAPNPFHGATRIAFSVPEAGRVSLAIFDVAGRRVRTLLDETRSSGSHDVNWDGRGDHGAVVAGGVYFYRLNAGGSTIDRRMVVLR